MTTDVTIYAPLAGALAGGSSDDYFSIDEFRRVTGDRKIPYHYDDEDILENQVEVVERLERWARTSWRIRTVTETVRSQIPRFLLSNVPVIAGSMAVNIDGDVITDHVIDLDSGIVSWGDWSGRPPDPLHTAGIWTVTYSYGFDDVPRSVSRPCIQACESLMLLQEDRSKIPRNATKYSSERTDITMGRRGAIQPWPWDARASDDIRAFWMAARPAGMVRSS